MKIERTGKGENWKIEINFDDEEWENVKSLLGSFLNKEVSEEHPITDRASFELKGPDGKVKQAERGTSR